jgi:hypothetical protein
MVNLQGVFLCTIACSPSDGEVVYARNPISSFSPDRCVASAGDIIPRLIPYCNIPSRRNFVIGLVIGIIKRAKSVARFGSDSNVSAASDAIS